MNTEHLSSIASMVVMYALFVISWRAALRTFEGLSVRWERFLDGTTSIISGGALGFVDLVFHGMAYVPRKSVRYLTRRPVLESGSLAHACAVLGLRESFTRQEFERQFRRTASAAHPNVTGSKWLSDQVHDAAELIEKMKGWETK